MDKNNYEIYEAKYKPVYGENWQIMISRKIQKEIDMKNGIDGEKSPLGEFFEAYNDIEGDDVFAAKRKNLGNSDKMPKENLENKGNFTMSVGDGKEFNAANIAKNLQGKITKAEKRRLELFGNFVNKSLKDRNFNNFFEFGRISAENAKRLKTIKNDLGQPMSFNLKTIFCEWMLMR